ncbi:MAG: hypothetical protein K6G71_06110 [Clostridiales bacterium]|nr:hypothetical protein [Clostridiales bacterium]
MKDKERPIASDRVLAEFRTENLANDEFEGSYTLTLPGELVFYDSGRTTFRSLGNDEFGDSLVTEVSVLNKKSAYIVRNSYDPLSVIVGSRYATNLKAPDDSEVTVGVFGKCAESNARVGRGGKMKISFTLDRFGLFTSEHSLTVNMSVCDRKPHR